MLLIAVLLAVSPLPPQARRQARELMERAQMCEHWAGEEAYDADRRRQIDKGFRDARCDTVKRDAARFRRAHPASPLSSKIVRATAWM